MVFSTTLVSALFNRPLDLQMPLRQRKSRSTLGELVRLFIAHLVGYLQASPQSSAHFVISAQQPRLTAEINRRAEMTGLGCTIAVIVFWSLAALLINADSCTTSEANILEGVTEDYADKVDSECNSDECSPTCVSVLSELVEELPDCVYEDGVNYYEGTVGFIESCRASSSGSTSVTSSGTGGHSSSSVCSSSEEADTDDAFDNYGDAFDEACTDYGICTSACLEVLDKLATVLPDCMDSEGINYYEAASYLSSTSPSYSRYQYGSNDHAATEPNNWNDSTSKSGYSSSESNDCSSSEEANINDAYNIYGDDYEEACADDTCSSACLAVLDNMAMALPDCVDSKGFNYYEHAIHMISACLSPSGDQSGSNNYAEAAPDNGNDSTSASADSSSGSNGIPRLKGLHAVTAAMAVITMFVV